MLALLGARIRWRRRPGLIVTAIALAMPTAVSALAFTADVVSRPSGEQYASAVMGAYAGEAILVRGNPGTPAEVLAERSARNFEVMAKDPGAVPIFVIRATDVRTPVGTEQMGVFARPWTPEVLYGDWLTLNQGRFPQVSGEVALSESAAVAASAALGDSVTVLGRTLRIVGIASRTQDLQSEDLFALPVDLSQSGDWLLEPRWLLSNADVQLGPEFVTRTRADVLSSGSSLAVRLPAPLVIGSLGLLALVVMLARVLDRDGEERLRVRLESLGMNRLQQGATELSGLAMVVVCAGFIIVPTVIAGMWGIRQRVWSAGERVPPPLEIPWVLMGLIAGVSLVVLVLASLLRRRPRVVTSAPPANADSASRALVKSSLTFDRRRLSWWGRVAIILGSLLVCASLTMATALETLQSANSMPTLLPGQIRVAAAGPATAPTIAPEFPDSMLADLRDALGVDVQRLQRLRLPGDVRFGANLVARTKSESGGISFVENATDFEWMMGRSISVDEQRALDEGKLLVSEPDRINLGDAKSVNVLEAVGVGNKYQRVIAGVPVVTIDPPVGVSPSSTFIAGWGFVDSVASQGVDVRAFTDAIVTAPGGDDSDAAMRAVVKIAEDYGFPAAAVRKRPIASDAVGQGARILISLLAAFSVCAAVLMSASLAVAGARRDHGLTRLGATWGKRLRLAVGNPLRIQGLRILIGSLAGVLLATAIAPVISLKAGIIVMPSATVFVAGMLIVAMSSCWFWLIMARRNRG
ncbi:unannotated protein [freshwater metagenome]|uniref:Unannotated protein n=1 Tax=freshwater metagenome TaxID=449393 RepID=A0A6J7HCH0_9ZZZZ|nr:hypothetical protein [Actinomycetota bacterium]